MSQRRLRQPTRGLWSRIVRMAAVAGPCAMVLFGLGIGAAAGAEKAPSTGYREYKVKSAFLYNSHLDRRRIVGDSIVDPDLTVSPYLAL